MEGITEEAMVEAMVEVRRTGSTTEVGVGSLAEVVALLMSSSKASIIFETGIMHEVISI